MSDPTRLPEKFDRIHIDGDILIYGICSACEYCARFDDDLDVVFCNINEAMGLAQSALSKYKIMAKGDLTIYFTGRGNFRKDLYPQYKAHRKKVRKPAGYAAIRDLLSNNHRIEMEDGLEADDLVGIHHTSCLNRGISSLMISSDKDFKTIPGWLYNPDTDAFTNHTQEDAERNWLFQTLVGDKSDGYPGLDGVGPVGAEKILSKNGPTWKTVEEAFTNSGFTKEFAVLQARMARILRDGEYDYMTKEVKLWQPVKS
jgi:DNA polymerase-1